MSKKIGAVLMFSMLAGACINESAFADRRSYVWTYEYQTMPKGMAEVEFYLTQEQNNIDRAKPNVWKPQVELEYGVTDHFDLSMYQMLKQTNAVSSSTFEYEGTKLRTRYRVLEKDALPVDVLLYLEYIIPANFKNRTELEGKLVFAKDIGKFNVAYNQVLKQKLQSTEMATHEYATGVNYEITPALKIGVESKGSYYAKKYYLGPTLSMATSKFWVNVGVAAGITKQSDDLQARVIMGVLF